jgi:hypothetical protein
LVTAANPKQVQAAIGKWLVRNREFPDADVVIRADVVTKCDFNLVVPVDVRSERALLAIVSRLQAIRGVKSILIARVLSHAPSPAVEAHCFIRRGETGGVYPKVRRYPQSPGANPWG